MRLHSNFLCEELLVDPREPIFGIRNTMMEDELVQLWQNVSEESAADLHKQN